MTIVFGVKSKLDHDLYEPQLSKLTTKSDWLRSSVISEPKLDGIRCIAYIQPDGSVYLINRSLNDVTDRFPEVRPHLSPDVKQTSAVIDGELIIEDGDFGVPNFNLIQTRMNRKLDIQVLANKHPAKFIAFDIIEWDGNFLSLPLLKRKELLDKVFGPDDKYQDVIHYVDYKESEAAVNVWKDQGFEGVIIKDINSHYSPGARNSDWLKYKFQRTKQFYVIGVTPGKGKREGLIGALLLARRDYEDDAGQSTQYQYKYCGQVGTGFTDDQLYTYTNYLHSNQLPNPYTHNVPSSVDLETWFYTKPILCRIKYLEVTNDGMLRFPVFQGFVESV